jgi:anaerobic magnesium-protoporphyrin IX monomethyl ester cyclase
VNVTLIFVGIASVGWNSLGRYPRWPEANMIHHGLASLSASLKAAGHTVDLVDLRALRGWGHFRAEVRRRSSDVWGVSIMSPDLEIARRCVDLIRREKSETVIVTGGVHPTVAPESLIDNPAIDYLVQGEGEISFPALLASLARGESSPRLIHGQPPDLDALPLIDRELFDVRAELDHSFYPGVLGLEPSLVTIVAGRGCSYNCSFCQPAERALFGPVVRRRSVGSVIAELRGLRDRYAFRSLMIHDDCLLEDPAWVVEFAHAYQAEPFGQPFYCQGRADLICRHEDALTRLAGAGLRAISIGFESGNDRVLRLLRKGVTVEQNRQAAAICHRLGLRIFGNYMLGLPTETPEEMMDTARLVRDLGAAFNNVSLYAPSPGSDLYDWCRQRGLLAEDTPHGFYRIRAPGKVCGVDYAAAGRAMEVALGVKGWRRLAQRLAANRTLVAVVSPLRRLSPARRAIAGVRRWVDGSDPKGLGDP